MWESCCLSSSKKAVVQKIDIVVVAHWLVWMVVCILPYIGTDIPMIHMQFMFSIFSLLLKEFSYSASNFFLMKNKLGRFGLSALSEFE